MRTFFILLFLLVPHVQAQTSRELLADGLFAEEANGDLKVAAERYEALLKAFEEERKIAATALYRLAQVRRKEGNEKEEVKLLQKVIVDFPGVPPLEKLARERLEKLGKVVPEGSASTMKALRPSSQSLPKDGTNHDRTQPNK